MEYLYLRQNNLTGTMPPELSALTALRTLAVYRNPFLGGDLPSSYRTMINLQNFCKSHTEYPMVNCHTAHVQFQQMPTSVPLLRFHPSGGP